MPPEHALFRSVPVTKESLVEWAKHLFRYMFQTQSARGAFMPPHRVEQNIFIVGVFQRSGERLETWKLNRFPSVSRRRAARFNK